MTTAPRIRPVAYIVQPVLMLDSDGALTPVEVQPVQVLAAQWPDVQAMMESALADLQAQVQVPEADTAPTPNRAARRSTGRGRAATG